jgi:hypothetical protein
MGAKSELRARAEGRLKARGAGDGMVDATKMKGRQQEGQQSRESCAMADRALQRLRHAAADRRQFAPPRAMQPAHTQSSRSWLVKILDELCVYDCVRAARKTKLERPALISASPGHKARIRQVP